MAYSAEVKQQDTLRFLQVLRLQRKMGPSLVTADSPWSPTIGLLLGTVLPATCAVATWEGRSAVALAHMARQSGREQWEIKHLVVAGSEEHASANNDVASFRLSVLLDEVCRLAGARRISGIVARVPEESRLIEAFHRAGFTSMMQELTFARSAPFGESTTDIPGLRLQRKRDAWPLHQLYLRSTPQVVRLSEGCTVRDWELRRSSSRLSFQVTRWVVEDQYGITGWLSETPGKSGEMRVQIGVSPGNGKLAQDLVAVALEHAHAAGQAIVWTRVPAHSTDARIAIENCGFVETSRGLVLKRSLAIRARDLAPAKEAKRRVARDGLTTAQSHTLTLQGNTGPPESARAKVPR